MRNTLTLALLATLTISLSGCGDSQKKDEAGGSGAQQTTNTQAPAQNGTGAVWTPSNVVPTPIPGSAPVSVSPSCRSAMNSWGTYVEIRGEICKRTTVVEVGNPMSVLTTATGSLPMLLPGNDTYAHAVGVDVRAGDRVRFSASGGWKTLDGWFYLVSASSCRENSIASSSGIHLGQPTTLVASIGGSILPLGARFDGIAQSSGAMKIGFNLDPSRNYCAYVPSARVTVEHCENASGTTVQCPF